MNLSKLTLAGMIAGLFAGFATHSLAEAPDPFNKAERNAALTTETAKTTPPTVTPPQPTGNTYVKPATRK